MIHKETKGQIKYTLVGDTKLYEKTYKKSDDPKDCGNYEVVADGPFRAF